jgi:hypothetical protein
LKAANIPYRDENGEYFDFHSLKHQAASFYGMNPETSEATRQKLTRHKTPAMARRYTHVDEQQQRKAIAALPDLRQASSEAMVQTGTDAEILSKSCFGDGQQYNQCSQWTEKRLDSEVKPRFCNSIEDVNRFK